MYKIQLPLIIFIAFMALCGLTWNAETGEVIEDNIVYGDYHLYYQTEYPEKFVVDEYLCYDNETKHIKELGKSGKICEIYGHVWVEDQDAEYKSSRDDMVIWSGYSFMVWGLTDSTPRRHCTICGKKQIKSNEWRDE